MKSFGSSIDETSVSFWVKTSSHNDIQSILGTFNDGSNSLTYHIYINTGDELVVLLMMLGIT